MYDEKRSPEENSARALFRLCHAVEQGNMKLNEIQIAITTLLHAVNSLKDAKR